MRTRKFLLFLVMVGALSLSFHGQVEAVEPQLGKFFSVVFALTNDIATLIALHEVTTPGANAKIRRWAWAVLIEAGGIALGLNVWWGLKTDALPDPSAIVVGAGPVVLAWMLSHLVALVFAARTEHSSVTAIAPSGGNTPQTASPTASAPASHPDDERKTKPVLDTSAARKTPGLESPGKRSGSGRDLVPARAGGTASCGEALVDMAERLERRALAESGGTRGLSYREAARRLRVRYPTARAALDAARSRMAKTAALNDPPGATSGSVA